ncbi:hypothetical protein V6N12_027640 [Hibiscus sabdariffa]|uniref:Uncharacterized protein n=1 Tax=Hibiscus sabdariffa TaxID=183260 RepID=A0ABR2F3G0_9ROSI
MSVPTGREESATGRETKSGRTRENFWRRKRSDSIRKDGIKDSRSDSMHDREGLNLTHETKRREIEGVIDMEKMEILNNCAVGFSCKPYQISDLAGYFRKARLDGFNVLRMADASILLMFDDEGKRKRKEIMESGVL